MRLVLAIILGMAVSAQSSALAAASAALPKTQAAPPAAPREDVIDDYFGTKVTDPYRWMEKGPKYEKFVDYLKSQNDYTRKQLGLLEKPRAKLLARIQELDNAVPVVRGWQRIGKDIFYLQMDPGATTSSLMLRDENGKDRKLFDPAQFDENGKHASIDFYSPSYDGKYVALGVSLGGSENSTIRVLDVASGKLLQDQITRTQYSFVSWLGDSRSFFYSRLQKLSKEASPSEVYENQKSYIHVLGRDADQDLAIFGAGVTEGVGVSKAGFNMVSFTPGSSYIIASHSAGTSDPSSIYACPVDKVLSGKPQWKQVASGDDGVSNCDSAGMLHGSTFYLVIDKNTPNRKVVAVDLDNPDLKNAKVVVPESDRVLRGIYAASDGLYVQYRRGVEFLLQRVPDYDFSKIKDIALPYTATASGIDSSTSMPGMLFRLESWTESGQAFVYDPFADKVLNCGLVPKHSADFSKIESRELSVPSTDGAMLPVSIICQKNIKLDASHPSILVGYGAYGISLDPSFDPGILAWIERGGVIAIAHLRGGGEFGEGWHDAGRMETKQHTIDDMLAAANYLINSKYTSPSKLAVKGTSAGGIAVGGAVVQHPELFAVAIDNVGMTDMLRFQSTQGGAANIPEFGDVTKKDEFKYLLEVSAYHHVKAGTKYPAVMGITGLNDPRVPSWMIAKMIASLQAASTSGKPILLRVDFDAGHGIGSTRNQREEQSADERTFALWQMGDPEFQPALGASN